MGKPKMEDLMEIVKCEITWFKKTTWKGFSNSYNIDYRTIKGTVTDANVFVHTHCLLVSTILRVCTEN